MPFFCNHFKCIKNKSVTLQVRILKTYLTRRKKVSLFASASLTLEAALAFPLILFAGVVLMMPFRMMDTHRQVQAAAEHVSEEIGQAAYVSEKMGIGSGWDEAAAWGYAEAALRSALKNLPVSRISVTRSSLLEDGETIDLVIDYEMALPFSVLGLSSMKQTNRSYRRAWVGAEGRNGSGEGQEDTIVYVGKNSTRYHVSRTCHYLYNDLTAVPAGEIENRRNQEGSRYAPCRRCKGQTGGTVYIMPYGRHYHVSRSCPAIQAYVKAVLKRDVEHLGACSYCSGKE